MQENNLEVPEIIDCDDLTTDFSEITYDYTGWCIECLLDVVSKRDRQMATHREINI